MMSWCRLVAISRILRNTPSRKCYCSSSVIKSEQVQIVQKTRLPRNQQITDEITDRDLANEEQPNILAPNLGLDVDFSDYGPALGRTQTFAAYVNKSPTLQKLVELGVDLSVVERKKDIPEKIMALDFEKDVTKHIQFLTDVGVPADALGALITRNPAILLEDIENMQKRIEYLMALKFEFRDFERLICSNPYWLCVSLGDMENRVSFFQNEFELSLPEFRQLALTYPKLITHKLQFIRANTFSISVEMGFRKSELKSMLMLKPRIWTLENKELVERFHFLHNSLKIPHQLIAKQPHCLLARVSHLRQRHFFLHSLGKAQYDPALPNYVSLLALITGSSAEFASNVAGTSAESFSRFLKTM